MSNWTKKLFRSRDSRYINLKKTPAAPWEMGTERRHITPAIRLYHPELRNCEYWLPYAEVFPSDNPDKRIKLVLDNTGHVLVALPVWEILQRLAGLGVDHELVMVGENHHPPPLSIGAGQPNGEPMKKVYHPKTKVAQDVMKASGRKSLPKGVRVVMKPTRKEKG